MSLPAVQLCLIIPILLKRESTQEALPAANLMGKTVLLLSFFSLSINENKLVSSTEFAPCQRLRGSQSSESPVRPSWEYFPPRLILRGHLPSVHSRTWGSCCCEQVDAPRARTLPCKSQKPDLHSWGVRVYLSHWDIMFGIGVTSQIKACVDISSPWWWGFIVLQNLNKGYSALMWLDWLLQFWKKPILPL